IMLATATAYAGEQEVAEARQAYREATAAVQAGDLDKALELFERAAAASPHAATHLAAGRTAFTLGNKARAADHFTRALQLGLEGADAKEAKTKLDQVSAQLGSVRITGTGGTVRMDGGTRLPTPAILHGVSGAHALEITKGDQRATVTVELEIGGQKAIDLDEALAPKADTAPAIPPPVPDKPERVSSFPNALTWVGVTGLVLGGLGGGATAGVGVAALSAKDDFLASRTQEDFDTAESLEMGTNISIGLSVGFGVLGASLLLGSVFMEEDAAATTALTADGFVIRF
ncbi:MAG: hypothetical protein HOV80_12140, partial [Polyangiaceae bacterium]|nr:hypothetical protein [Polyangiaceae bacterium]